jgi:hypothetical protein
LTWSSRDGTVRLWDVSIDQSIPLNERTLEYEVHTAMTLDSEGRPKVLTFSEWQPQSKRAQEIRALRNAKPK